MSYKEELSGYVNPDNKLMGMTPNAVNYSTGNPILDTATAYVLMKNLGLYELEDMRNMVSAFESCHTKLNPFFSKKPNVSDLVSHDDIIGIVAACAIGYQGEYVLSEIVVYGEKNHWLLSTTGKFYWDALVKPWHKAFYYMAIGEKPWIGGTLMLAAYILADALFNKSNSSDKKLVWLIVKTVKGKSKIVDKAIGVWNSRLKAVWVKMANVFGTYYGYDHILTRYCNE